MTQPRRVALVGCGAIAPNHLTALRELGLASALYLCDHQPEALKQTAQTFGADGTYQDLEALLAAEKPEVLHICTPHVNHPEMAELAVRYGAHVLTEKPVGTEPARCKALNGIFDASGKQVGVCFQNRYNRSTVKAMELIRSGEAGRLLGATAQVFWNRDNGYYQNSPWRGRYATEGGGLLINQAIHTLDLLRYFFGEPVQIQGQVTNWGHQGVIEVEDMAMARLVFGEGTSAVFFATNACVRNQPVRIELTFEQAVVVLEEGVSVRWHDGRTDIFEDRLPAGEKAYWGSSHKLLIQDFYTCLEENRPFGIPWKEGVRALEMVQTIAGRM